MKARLFAAAFFSAVTFFSLQLVSAQTDAPPVMSTPPVTLEEREEIYDRAIEDRTMKIMTALSMSDPEKSNHVHNAIFAHYHALRARDEAIDDELENVSGSSKEWQTQRVAMFPGMSKPLHERFIATISKDLTPEQLEIVKDKMTYGKVQFTYDGYCSIIPNLTGEEKAKILEMLKQAREVAMDGGSSGEKSAIFQQYKDQINAYLTAHGHDVAKAISDWTAKQQLAARQTTESMSSTNSEPKQ